TQLIEVLQEQLASIGGRGQSGDSGLSGDPQINPAALQFVPKDLAIKNKIMPITVDAAKKILYIGASGQVSPSVLDDVRFKTGLKVEVQKVTDFFLESAWKVH